MCVIRVRRAAHSENPSCSCPDARRRHVDSFAALATDRACFRLCLPIPPGPCGTPGGLKSSALKFTSPAGPHRWVQRLLTKSLCALCDFLTLPLPSFAQSYAGVFPVAGGTRADLARAVFAAMLLFVFFVGLGLLFMLYALFCFIVDSKPAESRQRRRPLSKAEGVRAGRVVILRAKQGRSPQTRPR